MLRGFTLRKKRRDDLWKAFFGLLTVALGLECYLVESQREARAGNR